MKVCGIVAEYNPFHNGHAYHIAKTKEQLNIDIIIAVMSGNFVQRGEPAVIDKWQRAKCAVENEIDIVVELPYLYATQSAKQFATGATHLLNLAQVDYLSFGSESNDLARLLAIANDINPPTATKQESLITAYNKQYGEHSPNDILGINYLRGIKDSGIKPILIKRSNAYHQTTLSGEISSASAIRKALELDIDYSQATPMRLNNNHQLKNYWPLIRTTLLCSAPEELNKYLLMDEGIENLLISNAKNCIDFNTFINKSTTKRYTTSRIKRTLLQMLMHIEKQQADQYELPNYLRLLAFNAKGADYLRYLQDEGVEVISRFGSLPQDEMIITQRAAALYAYVNDDEEANAFITIDERQPPIYVK